MMTPHCNVHVSIIAYLCFMGMLALLAVAIALLLFVSYLLQLLVQSVAELLHAFTSLDPTVQLLCIALGLVLVGWKISSRFKAVHYGH